MPKANLTKVLKAHKDVLTKHSTIIKKLINENKNKLKDIKLVNLLNNIDKMINNLFSILKKIEDANNKINTTKTVGSRTTSLIGPVKTEPSTSNNAKPSPSNSFGSTLTSSNKPTYKPTLSNFSNKKN